MVSPVYQFGPFRLEADRRRLMRGADTVPLTPKAFDTLLFLVENRDRAMKKADLMAALWPERSVEEATLTQNVFTLRKALGDDAEPHRYIETVVRHGYRFVAEVAPRGGEGVQAGDGPARGSRGRVAWIITAVVLLTALVAFLAGRPAPKVPFDSLAVLPFVNASGEAEADYVADGLTEGLINDVAQIPGVRVIARTTAFRYRSRASEPQRVGLELGVSHVLTGKVIAREGRVDVQSDLVDVETGTEVWGRRFSVPFGDLADVETAIAREIRGGMSANAATRPSSRPHSADDEAYRLYLRGRYFWNKRTAEGLRKSIELFRAATERDPEYARAYSGLADAYNVLPEFSSVPESQAYPAAREAAQKAIALDDTLAEAHTSLAFVRFWWDREWSDAERGFKRALELNPGYATAHHWYGNVLLAMGRVDEALAELKEAAAADPLSPIIGSELGSALYHARRFSEAEQQLWGALEVDPDFAIARYWLGRALLFQGRADEGIAEYRRASGLAGGPPAILAELGFAAARAGRTNEARRCLREVESWKGTQPIGESQAILYTGLGDKDRALAALDRAFEEHSIDLGFMGSDPIYDDLRTDPRFEAIQRRLHEPRSEADRAGR